MPKKGSNKIKEKIAKVSQQVVLQEEIEKLKQELEQQLAQARQQVAFWSKKMNETLGGLAVCNVLVKKAQRRLGR